MNREQIYDIVRDSSDVLAKRGVLNSALPKVPEDATLATLQINLEGFQSLVKEVEDRLSGRNLGFSVFMQPEKFLTLTLPHFIDQIERTLTNRNTTPIVVYVDDEEENIFIFRRRFGKSIHLKAFTDPKAAFEYIRHESQVRLVITDESMPGMSGNELCDAVHHIKPGLKFILITGNPNNESDLMYHSLRHNRFFEFINKPVDFEGKGEQYLAMFMRVLHTSY